MLRPRIIPCLLYHNDGLYKTFQFGAGKYIGDPFNAVRIFNEKLVDELIFIDIDATVKAKGPNYNLIRNVAKECRMPLCYGGGVKNVDQIEAIIGLGVEKVAISSAAVDRPQLIRDAAERVGSQSVVVVIDVKSRKSIGDVTYEVFTHNGTKASGLSAIEFARISQDMGAGEILVNSIDRDGTMQGYDIELVDQIRSVLSVPMTVLGGAGNMDDVNKLIKRHGLIGASAGSLFVFKGRFKAVLLQYVDEGDRIG
jgi:cyclase